MPSIQRLAFHIDKRSGTGNLTDASRYQFQIIMRERNMIKRFRCRYGPPHLYRRCLFGLRFHRWIINMDNLFILARVLVVIIGAEYLVPRS